MNSQEFLTSNEETTPKKPSKQPNNALSFLSTFGVIIGAALIAIFMMMFIFRSYQVDGPSMQPTLHNGDRLIIWKVPRTWARITGNTYIPNRGDIIVFGERGLTTPDGNTKELIKRVIGVPGDRVVVEDGTVTVYNKEHTDGFQPDTTLPYGEGMSLRTNSEEKIDQVVGKDQVYVMGDNRDNSMDSRIFGPVNASDIIGKLVMRIYPLSSAERF